MQYKDVINQSDKEVMETYVAHDACPRCLSKDIMHIGTQGKVDKLVALFDCHDCSFEFSLIFDLAELRFDPLQKCFDESHE